MMWDTNLVEEIVELADDRCDLLGQIAGVHRGRIERGSRKSIGMPQGDPKAGCCLEDPTAFATLDGRDPVVHSKKPKRKLCVRNARWGRALGKRDVRSTRVR